MEGGSGLEVSKEEIELKVIWVGPPLPFDSDDGSGVKEG